MKRLQYAALALTLSLWPMGAFAQKGSGAKFGARDARTCPSPKEPVKGAPNAAQLKQYVICGLESMKPAGSSGALLYLAGNVKVEVGKGRPFNIVTDSWPEVDPSQTVYPIRGTYMQWQCKVPEAPIPGVGNAPLAGKNCFKYETMSTAAGVCYKDTFGDWHCKICCAVSSSGSRVEFVPPPTVQ